MPQRRWIAVYHIQHTHVSNMMPNKFKQITSFRGKFRESRLANGKLVLTTLWQLGMINGKKSRMVTSILSIYWPLLALFYMQAKCLQNAGKMLKRKWAVHKNSTIFRIRVLLMSTSVRLFVLSSLSASKAFNSMDIFNLSLFLVQFMFPFQASISSFSIYSCSWRKKTLDLYLNRSKVQGTWAQHESVSNTALYTTCQWDELKIVVSECRLSG